MLLESTREGLWCAAGGFHIDPWRPVALAVVTHAHADHATPGCERYIASRNTLEIMKSRFSGPINGEAAEWGVEQPLGECRVSLHPAGHVLGSAQVRIKSRDETWCVTGDYKCEPDPSCEPFETVRCDTLLSECTFGLPIYRWRSPESVFTEMNTWWQHNADAGRTTVFLAYAFGKAQRILAGLDPTIGPIGLHGSATGPTDVYRAAGIKLPDAVHANRDTAEELRGRGAIICPPSATGTPWLRRFTGPEGMRLGFVSGWMQVRGRRRWQSVDRGFVMSDHADWDGLINTALASGARRVGLTHGSTGALARFLRERHGLDTFDVSTRYRGASDPSTRSGATA